MSGHSKWHNIQKTKGAQDAKRAAAFTKIAKEMIVAVKEGGGSTDPNNNSRLATVITKAKAANMPNDNIKRVLERAAGAGQGDNYESITYEGYGPSGVAVMVETMTDSRNRTAGNVRHHFDKFGGNMGASDFEAEETVFTIYTDPDDFNAVADALGKKYTFVSAQIEQVPNEYKKLESEEDIKMMEKLIDAFEDDDDVQNVWHNWDQD